ncbi:hypothetical protein BCS71_22455 [Vibrio lentus]|uniref:hypothetical protein n=1 Tax=Vibrio TaxID=662 RepID=UPI0002D5AF4D|nr:MULTISPECIES: hypothetical protein [Vibrio]OCH65351.1 hypothetical protein A6E08_14000 [Vibrio lentus]PMI55867.1 hypothetical protein BCU41_12740 [Vibrio lentus]
MSEIHIGMTRVPSVQDQGSEQAKAIVENSPLGQRVVNASRDTSSSQYLFTPGFSDPLDLIDQLLSKYIEDQSAKADETAQTIETQSSAIAEINRLWGLIMAETLPNTDPSNNDETGLKNVKISSNPDVYALDEIDRLIKKDLNDGQGIAAITGKELSATKGMNVSYGTLQEYNATMTAYCDTIQVDLDTQQQEFKNIMTEISSAQEEIRDVRRAIVAITQG